MPAPDFDSLEDYFHQVEGRMAKGEREYGTDSFRAPLPRLVLETMQEAEDIAGWSFILWQRCVKLLKTVQQMEAHKKDLEAKIDALQEALQGR